MWMNRTKCLKKRKQNRAHPRLRGGARRPTGGFRGDDESGPVQDWRDLPALHANGRKSARETWEQTEEKGGFVTAAEVPTDMGAFVTEISALEGQSLNAKTEEANAPEDRC